MQNFAVGQSVRVRPDAGGESSGVQGRRGTVEGLAVLPLDPETADPTEPGFLIHLAADGPQHDRWLVLPGDALDATELTR